MNVKEKTAKSIAKFVMTIARRSCGAASTLGTYQPKEPEALKNFKKK